MELKKNLSLVAEKLTFLRDFLCQAIDQVDEKDKWLTFKNPRIRIGTGRPEWGAEPGKNYFVITFGDRVE